MPRISPGAHLEVDRLAPRPAAAGRRRAGACSPIVRSPAGYSDSILRPTIDAMRLSWSKSAIGLQVTRPPSRRIVTRSPISNISSRWWLHVHDRVALVAQRVDAGQQRLGLALRQRRRRLVEDEHARVGAEHLGDLDELADGQRQRRDLGVGVQPVQADALEHRRATGGAARRGRVIPRTAGRWPISRFSADRQVGQQAELLVDDADAGLAHLGRARVADLLAVDQVVALVAPDGAGEDLDQRALAGAVLAGEAHDLAGAQLERDAVQRLDRPVGLGGVAQRDDRGLDGLGSGARLGGDVAPMATAPSRSAG